MKKSLSLNKNKHSTCKSNKNTLLLILSFLFIISGSASAQFTDTENCLLCHRYPTLGRYDDKTGEKRVFYINDDNFAGSGHGKIRCTECHIGLDSIPHPEKGKVDCSVKCHIIDPDTKQKFSHYKMVKKYNVSVHGKGTEENPKRNAGDLPTCQYCHDNRIYDHQEESEQVKWLKRSQNEIVALCSSCHADRKKMARHNLEAIDNYKDTFHWELLKYGVEDAPDCLDCHVPLGWSSHDITSVDHLSSPIYPANRIKTCGNPGGTQKCHPDATDDFATGKVHTYGIKAQLLSEKSIFDVEGRFKALMSKRTTDNLKEEDIYHYIILEALKLFYKIMIAAAIIFMGSHQLLDYRRVRRDQRSLSKDKKDLPR